MRTFTAQKVDILDDKGNIAKDENGKEIDFSFKNFAIDVLRSPVSDISSDKVVELAEVIRAIKPMKTGETIELSNDHGDLLKEAVKNMKFKLVSEDWADFIVHVKEM